VLKFKNKFGSLRVKEDILAAVSCLRKELTSLKSEVESTNKRILIWKPKLGKCTPY
jgi:hypothetical protein